MCADLRAVSTRIHSQSATDASRYANEPFHAAQVLLGAECHHDTQISRSAHVGSIPIDPHSRAHSRMMKDHPWQLAVRDQHVRAAAEKPVWNFLVGTHRHDFGS